MQWIVTRCARDEEAFWKKKAKKLEREWAWLSFLRVRKTEGKV